MKTKKIKHLHSWDQRRINVMVKDGVNIDIASVIEYLSQAGAASTLDITHGTKLQESHVRNAIKWLSVRKLLYTKNFHIKGLDTDCNILACPKKYIVWDILNSIYERTRYLPKEDPRWRK